MEQRPMTYGEKACGVSFNPSNDPNVDSIKRAFADIVDELHDLRAETMNPEIARMLSLAITDAQTAQMWAVKAVTWRHA